MSEGFELLLAEDEEQTAELAKKPSKAKYARVGEKVRVLVPKEFVRVGYPLCPSVVRDARQEDLNKLVFEMAKAIGAIRSLSVEVAAFHDELTLTDKVVDAYKPFWLDEIDGRLKRDLEKAAITHILRSERFGGSERKVYEKDAPDLLDKVAKVADKKVVKTGIHYGPSGGYDYYSGEYDYEPGGLTDCKTHVVYHLAFNQLTEFRCVGDLWILAENCEIVPAE